MSNKECITIEGVEYYCKEQLGQGGAGAVFRAETNDGNEYALKKVKVSSEFIDAEKSGREPRYSKEERFLREIKFCLEDHSPLLKLADMRCVDQVKMRIYITRCPYVQVA